MRSQLEQLLHRLQQADGNLSRRDFEHFSDLNRNELSCFVDLWSSIPDRARVGLVSTLAQLAAESLEYDFERVFREVLKDPDPDARLAAVKGLWECEDDALAGQFLHMLEHDPDDKVRAAVASGLGHYIYLAEMEELEPALGAAIETALLTTIHNPTVSLEVRRRAVEAISFSCNPEVPDIIRDAYEHEEPLMRVSAVFAMGRSADRRWSKTILQELLSPDSEIRFEAVRAAGELSISDALQPMARMLDDEDDLSIRQAIVWALGQIGGNAARRLLEHVIASQEEALYEIAQDSLDELSFQAEFPEIVELLQSSDDEPLDDLSGYLDDEWGWAFDELDPYSDDLLDDDDDDDEEPLM
jgi:HEAT repeat protein